MMNFSSQHSRKLQRPLKFCNRWSTGFYNSVKMLHYCLLQLRWAEKKEEWKNMKRSRLL
ncbi:hypothetical protein MXB_5021 [Myxobolus squamalis]|nr:hypothetical protein MXB_5021 [Myxobolus squamalis]